MSSEYASVKLGEIVAIAQADADNATEMDNQAMAARRLADWLASLRERLADKDTGLGGSFQMFFADALNDTVAKLLSHLAHAENTVRPQVTVLSDVARTARETRQALSELETDKGLAEPLADARARSIMDTAATRYAEGVSTLPATREYSGPRITEPGGDDRSAAPVHSGTTTGIPLPDNGSRLATETGAGSFAPELQGFTPAAPPVATPGPALATPAVPLTPTTPVIPVMGAGGHFRVPGPPPALPRSLLGTPIRQPASPTPSMPRPIPAAPAPRPPGRTVPPVIGQRANGGAPTTTRAPRPVRTLHPQVIGQRGTAARVEPKPRAASVRTAGSTAVNRVSGAGVRAGQAMPAGSGPGAPVRIVASSVPEQPSPQRAWVRAPRAPRGYTAAVIRGSVRPGTVAAEPVPYRRQRDVADDGGSETTGGPNVTVTF